MKTTIGILVLIMLLGVSSSWAGEIFGTVRSGRRAVRAQVTVTCGPRTYGPVTTDNFGSYRLFVRERGQCILTVHYQGRPLNMRITSYERPIRYDIQVGGGSLQRR